MRLTPATITLRGSRGDDLERICGVRSLPVLVCAAPPVNGKRHIKACLLDEEAVAKDVLAAIVRDLAAKAELPEETVCYALSISGIPIRGDDADVTPRVTPLVTPRALPAGGN